MTTNLPGQRTPIVDKLAVRDRFSMVNRSIAEVLDRQRMMDWIEFVHPCEWESSPLQQMEDLVFAFIRIPHRLSPYWQSRIAPDGRSVLSSLRRCFPEPSVRDEKDVHKRATATVEFLDSLRESYPRLPTEYIAARKNGLSPNAGDSLWQLKFDAIERAKSHAKHRYRLRMQLKLESHRFLDLAGDSQLTSEEQEVCNEIARQLSDHADHPEKLSSDVDRHNHREQLTTMRPETSNPLGSATLEKISGLLATDDESAGKHEATHERTIQAPIRETQFLWNGEERRVVIRRAQPESPDDARRRYEETRRTQAAQIHNLRESLRPQGEQARWRSGQSSGKLARRELWRSSFDDRIFSQKVL